MDPERNHASPLGRLARSVRRELGSWRFLLGIAVSPRRRELARELLSRHQWFHATSTQNLMGSLTDGDLARVRMAIEQASSWPGPIVEIGCLFGFTTQFIAHAKPRDKELVTIDSFSWNPFLMHPDIHRRSRGGRWATASRRVRRRSSTATHASSTSPTGGLRHPWCSSTATTRTRQSAKISPGRSRLASRSFRVTTTPRCILGCSEP